MLLVKSHCKVLASCKKHKSGSKIIIDLALKGYLAEPPHGEPVQGIDSIIQEIVMSQLKLFIFDGHDTIATTICYSYSLLSRNPSMLRKLREEHDNVLGTDIERAPDLLASQPHLLNQLPYTLATIREILRLFPVVTCPRAGRRGYELTDSERRRCPTEHCLVWSNHHGLHNNPLYWPKVEELLPDRWLVPETHPLHLIKNAWTPFEFGPRNCIDQEPALTELFVLRMRTGMHLVVGGKESRLSIEKEPLTSSWVAHGQAMDFLPGQISPADSLETQLNHFSTCLILASQTVKSSRRIS